MSVQSATSGRLTKEEIGAVKWRKENLGGRTGACSSDAGCTVSQSSTGSQFVYVPDTDNPYYKGHWQHPDCAATRWTVFSKGEELAVNDAQPTERDGLSLTNEPQEPPESSSRGTAATTRTSGHTAGLLRSKRYSPPKNGATGTCDEPQEVFSPSNRRDGTGLRSIRSKMMRWLRPTSRTT